jgi:hypothetical protein
MNRLSIRTVSMESPFSSSNCAWSKYPQSSPTYSAARTSPADPFAIDRK